VRGADKANSNHGISAQKFQLIKEFLTLGCARAASSLLLFPGLEGRGGRGAAGAARCVLRPPSTDAPPPLPTRRNGGNAPQVQRAAVGHGHRDAAQPL